MIKGKIIGGSFHKVIIREKLGENIQLGELLVTEDTELTPDNKNGIKNKILLQVYDLCYASQLSQQHLELISGLQLENKNEIQFFDQELRNYRLVFAKNLIAFQNNETVLCKTLPAFFSDIRTVKKEDFPVKHQEEHEIVLGNLRSGSTTIDFPVCLDGNKVFSEHILIAASTGKGKSNLTSCLLFESVAKDYCGILVFDPHDEYYGRNKLGLKDHPLKDKISYYTAYKVPVGCFNLKINISKIKPNHFNGVVSWSDAQKEALYAYYRQYKEEWIAALLTDKKEVEGFHEGTLAVVKRKLMNLLDIKVREEQLFCYGLFDTVAGENTVSDICNKLEQGNTAIIDTSLFPNAVEILLASLLTAEIFSKYKKYKIDGLLEEKPIISIVLEEAPRVLSQEMAQAGNIFSTIAREGRKFKVGLIAITQVPSLIPREILANMNTKIILGLEMAPERQAIIESAAQDLRDDHQTIASLDKGEALISSVFVHFATPVKIPAFAEIVKKYQLAFNRSSTNNSHKQFIGINKL